MAILNPSFETAGATIGQADNWTWVVDTTGSAIVFSDINSEFENFAWEETDDTFSGIPADFNDSDYETFNWFYYYSQWGSNWTESISDEFDWTTFDDTYSYSGFTGYDDFAWTSFDDILVSIKADFNLGTPEATYYESFENHW